MFYFFVTLLFHRKATPRCMFLIFCFKHIRNKFAKNYLEKTLRGFYFGIHDILYRVNKTGLATVNGHTDNFSQM